MATWYWSFREVRVSEEGGYGEGASGTRGGEAEWEAFRRNRMALLGAGVLLGLYLALLLTPFLAPFGPEFRTAYQAGGDMSGILSPPSLRHPFGTDQYSQDILSRLLYGARISLTIGLLAVGISVAVGTTLGAIAGYLGGRADFVVMRAVDLVMAFPRLVLLISIVALFPTNFFLVALALAFTQWPFTVRLVRGEILSLKEREFAEAARALGFSRRRILFRHLLPNAAGPIIVMAMLGVGNAIILEAGLSFLGMGVEAGTPSWGGMVNDGRELLTSHWWVATFPGLAIVTAVMAFNLVGDGLRDALDPRLGKGVRP
jgi:peptide/nickel transport system permease protein